MRNDFHNSISCVDAVSPAAARTTTTTGAAVDLAGYESVAFAFISGTITDGTHTPKLTECDTVGGSYTDVAAADQSGTLAAIGSDEVQEVSYIGSKRFVKAVITVTGSPSTGGVYQVTAVRGRPRSQPAT